MKTNILHAVGLTSIVGFLVLGGVLLAEPAKPKVEAPVLPISTVKVMIERGHGSGVHLGNGFVITAQHVVTSNTKVKLKTQDSTVVEAVVLWSNPIYDTALLYAPELKAQASALTCRAPVVGEFIRASGNPFHIEFSQTWGNVAGTAPVSEDDKGGTVVDIVFAPGMSGGPVFDGEDKILGIVQGGMRGAGINFMIPSSAICHLFGRVS